MPIEIKEMHIKINIDEAGTKQASSNTDKKGKTLEECVEEVMRILKNKEER